jgi:hypothetical protein
VISFKFQHRKGLLRDRIDVFAGKDENHYEITGHLKVRRDEAIALWRLLEGDKTAEGRLFDIEIEVAQG